MKVEVLSKILTGKPTRKSLLEKPRCKWEDNIRTNLKEIVSIGGNGLIRLKIGITIDPL